MLSTHIARILARVPKDEIAAGIPEVRKPRERNRQWCARRDDVRNGRYIGVKDDDVSGI